MDSPVKMDSPEPPERLEPLMSVREPPDDLDRAELDILVDLEIG